MPPRPPQHANQFHNNRHTYIPERAQRIMAKRMERAVPASMKKYVEPYMQQNVVGPAVAGTGFSPQPAPHFTPQPAPHFTPHPIAAPNFQQQNRFQQPGAQPPQPTQPLQQPQLPVAPAVPAAIAPVPMPNPGPQPQAQPGGLGPAPQPYDFMMNPDQPPPGRSLSLPGLNSTLKRVVFGVGSLIILLIIFTVVKGLFKGGSDLPLFVGVAQDQQEILHLVGNVNTPSQQQALSDSSLNFVVTANASLLSSQGAMLTYLANNGDKVKPKELNLKLSQQLDDQLTSSTTSGTYDQTFQQVMKTVMTSYINRLNLTYKQTSGKKGRALLVDDYKQAKLLLSQLNAR